MSDDTKQVPPPEIPQPPTGLFPRWSQAVFDFFFAKPGRRAADYSRANLNVKLLAALIACLAASWKYINSLQAQNERMLTQQQQAYERLVNQMMTQFQSQNRDQLAALERLRLAQEETAKEQRANTETVREAFLIRAGNSTRKTP